MEKSRTIGTNYGIYKDSLHTGLSYGVWSYAMPESIKWARDNLLQAYAKAASLRTIPVALPSYAGKEEFSSTENVRPLWNECRHLKNSITCNSFATFWQELNNPTYYYHEPFYRRELPKGTKPWDGSTMNLQFGDFEDARRRAWWSMQPRFEGEVSMLNFIFELKDFRDMAKAFSKLHKPAELADQMKRHQAGLRKIKKGLAQKDRSLASMTQEVVKQGMSTGRIIAQLRLINEFAIKPLISDCGTILAQIGQCVREAQSDFESRGLKPQVSHFSETKVHTDSLKPATKTKYWLGLGEYSSTRFTASLEYKYNYTLRSQSEAFLKYWGLKSTPEVIWNATPFSFLADYFYKIGQAIHTMSIDPNVSLMQVQYSESLLYQYSSGYAIISDPRANLCVNGVIPSRGVPITAHTGSFYQRRLTSPNKGMATPVFKLPSGNQGANMAALAMCFIK